MDTPHAALRCIICQYDLVGLNESGVCPECATPVERSLRGPWLRYEDLEWLTRTASGLGILRQSLLTAGYALGSMLALTIFLVFFGFLGSGLADWIITVCLGLLALGAVVLAGALVLGYMPACWFATPGKQSGPSVIDDWRLVIRWTSWAPVALSLGAVAARFGVPLFLGLPSWSADILTSMIVICLCVHDRAMRLAMRAIARHTAGFEQDRERLRKHRGLRSQSVILFVLLMGVVWIPFVASVRGPAASGLSGLASLIAAVAVVSLSAPVCDAWRGAQQELALAREAIGGIPVDHAAMKRESRARILAMPRDIEVGEKPSTDDQLPQGRDSNAPQ